MRLEKEKHWKEELLEKRKTKTENLFFLRFYLFIHRHRQREAETQAEGETGSMQGARRGTPSRVPRIRPWAEGGAKPLSHLGCPLFFLKILFIYS